MEPQARGDPLRVTLELASDSVAAGDSISATVTLANDGETPITVLRPFAAPPIVRFRAEDSDGNRLSFEGVRIKLAPPEAEDFATLAPGESVSESFDLAEMFEFEPGVYGIWADYVADDPGERHGFDALVTGPDPGLSSNHVALTVR